MQNREPYWDYMGRRMREEREIDSISPMEKDNAQLTESYYKALRRIKYLVEENYILKKK